MQKSAPSVEGNAGPSGSRYKPWPVMGRDAGVAKKQDIVSLSARFNPRLIGFGILGPAAEISDRREELHASVRGAEPQYKAESEEQK
jgi:hypothetical protein